MKIICIFLSCLGLFLINPYVTFAQTEGVGYACNDWVDNDGDGLADCDDSDCHYPANVERGCNCDDGDDNDGDGFIDSGDADCAAFYGLSFIGEGSDCSIQPPVSTDGFNVLTNPTVSGQNTVDTQSKMAIGDIDGDGIPDVVATSKWNQTIRVIATTNNQDDGSDAGDVKSDWKSPGAPNMPKGNWFLELEVAIADIDRDGKSELFTVASLRKNANSEPEAYTIVGFTYEEKSLVPLWDAIEIGPDRPGIFGLADFDGDGQAEIYVRNRIYAAETGELLADAGGNWDTEVNAAPVAVNIDRSNPNLELAIGEYIYTVPNLVRDGNNATLNTLTVWKNMNDLLPAADKYFPKTYVDLKEYGTDNFSSTSVADFDGDGNIDVFLSGARENSIGKTAIYYWNVATGQVQIYIPQDPNYANGWPWGTGRVNLGEVDGDGMLEANFIAGSQLFVLDLEAGLLTLKYVKTINDSRSGVVATTVYDFDNDGAPELVYRDAAELVVVDGETGDEEWAVPCESHTMTEGPIIADVNGDGGTDICVPCSRNGGIDVIKDGVQLQALGEIRLFYSAEGNWLPTRQVWNQSGYFVINILDDLTLPLRQMDMPIVFSEGPCDNGIPGPIRPFNTFLNQVPTLGPGGCPIYPGPDVSFNGDDPLAPGADPADPNFNSAANVIPPVCGDLGIKAFFDIVNNGALPINTSIPVSFWDGNPTLATDTTTGQAAVLLHTYDLLLNNLQVGDSLITDTTEFNSTGRAFRLWIILNDDGNTFPVTLDDPEFVECDIANNVYYIDITPEPFTVEIQKNGENIKCDLSAPDNGELQALIFEEGVETSDYSKYGLQWYYGSGTGNPIPAANGGNSQVLSGLFGDVDGEIYSLVVTNIDKGCQSLVVQDTIFGLQTVPTFSIAINNHQTVCSPPNGELEVTIDGGNTGFTIEWFDNLFNPTGITGPVASNLTEGEWIVRISSGDGCQEISSQTIDGPVEPDATATTLKHILDCEDLSSGQITADAFIGGVLQDSTGYTFNWYYADSVGGTLGSPLPPAHGSGPTRSGLPAGSYGVIVTDLGTQCDSELIVYTEVEDQRNYPAVVISEVQPQLSCDPSLPNGILRADVIDGGTPQDPANYVFEWFAGDNTLAANLHTDTDGTNGEIANNVPGGGMYYTVRVTNLDNCAQTDKFIISEQKILPVLTLDSIPNTVCDESLASSAYTGQVIGSVTYDGTTVTLPNANYEFTWYQGTTTGGAVLSNSSATDNSLENLDGGYYTVVVTRADYFCESIPVTIEVTEQEVLPVIEVTTTPMTTCAGTPNGTATATVDGGIAGYTFEWFVGTNITVTGTNVAGATNVATGLDGNAGSNTYTVLATNTNTGCQSSLSVNIPDNTILPTLNLTSTPNSTCDPGFSDFTGTITASFIDPNGETPRDINDYTFTWLDSLGNNALAISGSSVSQDSILMNIPSGIFSVIVSNDVLGCTSDPVSVFVDSVKVLPNIVIDPLVAMTACDTTLANGSATALVVVGTDTTTNNHSFEWYRGTTASGTILSATNFVDQLNGFNTKNNYIVKAVNQSTGCESTEIIAVPENNVLPTSVPTSTPNSICDPSLTVPEVEFNGTITIPVTDANAQAGDSYEFELFSGATSLGTQTDNNVFTELADGTYTVTITNLRLGCTSDPITIEVEEEQILPVIDISLTPMTSCDTSSPNGGASALIGGTTTGYSFAWYVGPTITASSIGTSASITGLDGTTGSNTYTLLVTDLSSGCQSTESFNVPDSTILPTTVPISTPNSICDPALTNPSVQFNGTITIPVTDPNAIAGDSYEFELFSGVTSLGTQTDDNIFTELADGTYEVTVTNLRLGCTSDPVTIVVDDDQVLPVVDLTVTPMTSCDPTAPNGGAAAEVGGNTAGYTFEWFTGSDASIAANSLGVSTSVTGFDGTSGQNTYTVLVTDLSSGCQITESFNVPDSTILPTTVPTSTPNNICDPTLTSPAAQYNGTITIPVTDPNALVGDSYEFELFSGVTSLGTQTDNNVFTGLADGTYEVTITNTRLGCTSDPVTIVVDDDQNLPVIDNTITPMTSCDPTAPNGGASAEIGGTTTGYSFEWFTGTDVTGTSLGTSATISGLDGTAGSNTYTLLVTDLSSGCQSTESFNVPDNSILPTTIPTSTPNDICDPALTNPSVQFSGTITIPVTDANALAGDDYDYELFLSNASQGTQTNDNVFTGLEDDTYEVTVTNTRLGCTSDRVTIVVGNAQNLPVIDLTVIPMTSCDPTDPNGGASAEIGGTTSGYSFEWFTGTDVTGTSLGTLASVAGLDGTAGANTYTLLVTDLSSGCQSTESFNVPDRSTLPTFTLEADPNAVCDPDQASEEFTGEIRVVALSDTNFVAGHTYTYVFTNIGTAAVVSQATATLSNLVDGDYEVTVTNDQLGCTSDPVQVEVEFDPVIPVVTRTLTPSTNCDAGDNGQIEITTIDGAAPTADYSIYWYDGNVIKYDGGGARTPDFTGAVYSGIPGGVKYTVEIVNNLTGCTFTESYTLPDRSALPTFTLEADPNEVCDDALASSEFTGEIRIINFADTNFVAGHTYTYTYTNIGTSEVFTPGAFTLSDLPHGDYEVTVTNDQLGCTSDPVQVEVDFTPTAPVITRVLTPSTNCDAADNGQIEITDVDAGADLSGYTINWYNGSSVKATTDGTGAVYSGIPGGANYTVQVINNTTGCSTVASYTLADQSAVPVVTLTKGDNTICDENIGYDGSVTAAVTYKTAPVANQDANYVFTWYEGTTTGGSVIAVSDNTDQVLAGLDGGFYTVTVTNVELGCTSNPRTIEVKDVIYTPVLNVAVTPQTNCVDFSGELAITINETSIGGAAVADPSDYTFTWFSYNNTTQVSTPIAVGVQNMDGASFTELPSGYYRVVVERNSTGCTRDRVMFVPESITVPAVNITGVTDLTSCDAPDGQLEATIADEANYTFYWYHDNDAVDEDFVIANADATIVGDGTYTGLFPGLYTVVAVHNATGCISPMDTEEVLDGSIDITIVVDFDINPTECNENNGQMTANPDIAGGGTVPTDFSFEWYNGAPTNTEPINFFTNPPVFADPTIIETAQTITGLTQGTFTVIVTYNNTGCRELETVFLPFADAPVVTSTITNSTLCPSTIGNGEIEITINTAAVDPLLVPIGDPTLAIDNDNFTLRLYSGANAGAGTLLLGPIELDNPPYGPNDPITVATGLTPGFYTIELLEDYTGDVCPLYHVVEIKADAKPPVISLNGDITPNTACIEEEADGEFTVQWAKHPDDENINPVTYDISISPDDNNVNGTAPLTAVGVGSFTFDQLLPGTYAVTVLASTGCSSTRNFTVTDQPVTAEIANGNFTDNPANLCLPSGNAEITDLTLVDGGTSEDMTDYVFTWFSDAALTTNVTGPAAGDPANATGGDYLDLAALGIEEGTFYVVATKTNDNSGTGGVGCISTPFEVEIEDVSEDPVVNLVGNTNTACDTGYEGSVEIEVTDTYAAGLGLGAADFDITLSGASGLSAGPHFFDDSNGSAIQEDLQEDTYTATVISNITGCTTSEVVSIVKNTQPLIINTVVKTDQTICDPNGTVEVTEIVLQGVDESPIDGADDTDNLANYTFSWYTNSSLTVGSQLADTDALIDNMPAGEYYVVAKKTSGAPGSGCESLPYKEVIKDVSVDPVIALKGFANTACDNNFEGSIEVNITETTGAGVGQEYTYNITGTLISTLNDQSGITNTIPDLGDGSYTVTAINELTLCDATATVTIQKNVQPIIVNQVTTTDQTICGPNGEIEVTNIILEGIDSDNNGVDDSDVLTNYEFDWFTDAGLSASTGDATPVLASILAGDYYVVARKVLGSPGSGCESAPFRADVKDVSVDPVIALTGFSNTACDNNFEGSIEIDVSDPSGAGTGGTYQYDITGPNAYASNTIGETGVDNTRIGLEDGTYTVIATNETTFCPTTGTVTIKKNTQPIIVSQVTHLEQTICGPNGEVEVVDIILQGYDGDSDGTDDSDDLANYEFDWYSDSGLSVSVGDATSVLSAVLAGDYYVVARKVTGAPGSGCESAPFRTDVKDVSVAPVIALTGFSNTACDNDFEGSIEIDVADPSGPGVGSTFQYDITGPNAYVSNTTSETGIDDTRSNLEDGAYTVLATNETTFCSTSGTVTIKKNTQPIIVNQVTHLDQSICGPNGEVEVVDIILQGIDADNNGTDDSDDLANYEFDWYSDASLSVPVGDATSVLSAVLAGDYYVVARKVTGSPGSGCESAPYRTDIKDISVDPVIALTGFSNTACDNNFEGSIEIDVADPSGPGVGGTFEYIFTGTTVIAGTTGETGIDNTRDNLADGTYTVTAINEITGCDTKGTVTIQKNQQPIFVTNFNITDQDFCTPNGIVEVTQIILQGIDQDNNGQDDQDDLANYSFEWFNDAQLTDALADTDVDIDGVAKGDYYVVATKNTGSPGSGCSTPPLRADVKDISVDPVIALTGFSNTACDNNFEGSIEIDVADPSGPGIGATFEYIFTGPTVIAGITGETGVDNSRNNLADGTYTVTAINEITGCDTKGTVTIQKNQQPIFVTNFNITDQDFCAPLENGAVEVAQIILQGIDDDNDGNDDEDDLSNYTYIWFNDGALQDTIADTDVEINDLAKGDYYVVATKVTGAPGSGCSTPPLRADVKDVSINPVIALSSTSNSACDPASSDGGIVINVTDNGVNPTTYTYNWLTTTNASGVIPSDSSSIDATASWDELEPGVYSIEVVSDGTGCFTSGTVTVLDNPSIPMVQDADVFVTDQDLCDPSGSIIINSIDPGVLTDYTFEWRKGADFDAADVVGDAQPVINNTTYTDISAGSYWFLATKNTGTDGAGDGCVAPPVRVEMDDISERPTLTMSSIANTACDNAFDASITLNLTEVTGTPGVGGDYRVIWTSFPTEATIADADPVSSGYTTGGTDLVAPGTYNVEVENNATGCPATGSITVQDNPQPIDIVTIEVEDQMICFPDGRITVTVTNPSDVPDYSYTWYRGEVNQGAELEDATATLITSNEITNANYQDMGAGTYFIIATRNSGTGPGSGCPSAPFRAEVGDLSVDPKAVLSTTSNTACDPALSNGTINAIASEQDGSTDDYTFTWAYNNGALPAGASQTDASPVSDIANALDGNYNVNIFNTLTGCAIDASIKVTIDSLASEPNIIDVDVTLPLDCNPSGSAEVTRLIIGGVTDVTDPVALANDYDYGWFEGDFVPSAQIAGEFGSRIDFALAEGNYFITVTSLATGCESEPKEFIVDNSMIIYPDMTVDQTIPQINCIGPPFGAELVATSVEEDGSIGPGYSFTWTYDSLMNENYTSLPGYVPTPTVSGNVGTAYNLPVGLFKVITTNTTTNCADSAFFVVIDESEKFLPQVRTGSEPLTMCYAPNGVAFGQTISINNYPYPEDYTFDWYEGATPDVTQPADYPDSPRTSDLPEGNYTVKVTDNNTGCITTESITINDERVYPEVRITLDNPVTNCDDTRPNGQLTAIVDNGAKVSDYLFRWFDAPDTTDISTYFSDHFRVSNLDVGDYTVSAMRALTGCANIASETITFEPLTVPIPTPLLLASQTSCLDPNGMLQVSVDGKVTGYLFDWYEAGAQSSFAGDIVLKDLVAGDYEVATFEIETGCLSERVPITLPENLVYPEFEFRITPSACEFATGAAEVLVINNANINSVEWTDEFGFTVGYGGGIYDIFAGTYNVIAITTLGCATEEQVEVHTDILDFNLVAPNGNSANSYFHVDCISNFPDNHVQIYNRTGVLVWEATGYDNVGTKFTGVGANGLYLMGDELPEGTYFYIIDKKDGSKPIAGYLELIR